MALKNKSMYAILGILSLSPGTGYDIKKYCDRVLSGFWNENFGHIYPTLKMMLEDGMIEVTSQDKTEKKIQYSITEKGKQELDGWLQEKTVPQPVRSEFMLKLLFSSSEPRKNILRMLQEYKEFHEQNIEQYLGMQKELELGIQGVTREREVFLGAVLRKGIVSSEADIRWCEETMEEIAMTVS